MNNEFVPDVLINVDAGPIFADVSAYLDGVLLERCYEARVTFKSFLEPAFGEVIVGREEVEPVIYSMPRLGEFEHQGLWVHFRCGKVQIVSREGRAEAVASWLAAITALKNG